MGLSDGLLRSELNSTSDRFDYLSAAPSSHELFIVWTTWSALSGIVAVLAILFFLAILSSRKARNRSFNVYLLFITFPDIFFSVACCVTCALNAAGGSYYSEQMCSFQSFYCTFAFAANAWMNATVVRQVHIMLQSSHRRKRYKPPPKRTVYVQAAFVYLYSIIIASIPLWGTPVLQEGAVRGLACLPLEHNLQSSLFFWLFFFWLMMGIPLVYVVYVWIDVKRRKLLPPGGRTRSVAVFFARITFVFVFMWFPTMVAIYMIPMIKSVWFGFVGGAWSHLQPVACIGVSMKKGDIAEAVWNFLCCRRSSSSSTANTDPTGDEDEVQDTDLTPKRPHRSSIFASFLLSSVRQPMASLRRQNNPDGIAGSDSDKVDETAYADGQRLPATQSTGSTAFGSGVDSCGAEHRESSSKEEEGKDDSDRHDDLFVVDEAPGNGTSIKGDEEV